MWPKPSDNTRGLAVDVTHTLDLPTFLIVILLIDAHCIAPRSDGTRSS